MHGCCRLDPIARALEKKTFFGFKLSIGKRSTFRGLGEVIVHRGPEILHGCKVHISGGKNRGPTWDFDRCYVRILYAGKLRFLSLGFLCFCFGSSCIAIGVLIFK